MDANDRKSDIIGAILQISHSDTRLPSEDRSLAMFDMIDPFRSDLPHWHPRRLFDGFECTRVLPYDRSCLPKRSLPKMPLRSYFDTLIILRKPGH